MEFFSISLTRGCHGIIAEVTCGPGEGDWPTETIRQTFATLIAHLQAEGHYAITLIFPLATHQKLIVAAGDVGFKSGGQSYGKDAQWKGFYLLQEEKGISRRERRRKRNSHEQAEERSVPTRPGAPRRHRHPESAGQ